MSKLLDYTGLGHFKDKMEGEISPIRQELIGYNKKIVKSFLGCPKSLYIAKTNTSDYYPLNISVSNGDSIRFSLIMSSDYVSGSFINIYGEKNGVFTLLNTYSTIGIKTIDFLSAYDELYAQFKGVYNYGCVFLFHFQKFSLRDIYESLYENSYRTETSVNATWTSGKIVTNSFTISTSTSYKYSNPTPVNRGQIVKVVSYGNAYYSLAESDVNGNLIRPLEGTYLTTNETRTFYYIAERDMYVIACVYNNDSAKFIISDIEDINQETSKIDGNAQKINSNIYDILSPVTLLFEYGDYPYNSGGNKYFGVSPKAGDKIYISTIDNGTYTHPAPWNSLGFYLDGLLADGTTEQIESRSSPQSLLEVAITKNYVDIGVRLKVSSSSNYGDIGFRLGADNWRSEVDSSISAVRFDESLPQYYDNYITQRGKDIRNTMLSIDGKSDTLVFITDSHWRTNWKKSPAIIKYLLQFGLTDKVVFGGDVCSLYSTEEGGHEDTLLQIDFHRKFMASVMDYAQIYNIRGNHDLNGYPGTSTQVEQEQLAMWYATENSTRNILQQNLPNSISDNGFNYYWDNDHQGVRYIALYLILSSHYTAAFKSWFLNAITTTPAGYTIVILNHDGIIQTVGGDYPTRTGATEMLNILSAVNNNSSITIDGTQYDFSQAEYSILALISGHTHKDLQTIYDGVAHICTGGDIWLAPGTELGAKASSRVGGTITEQLMDFIQFDFENKEVHCLRLGCGYDRLFHNTAIPVISGNTATLTPSKITATSWGSYNSETPHSSPENDIVSVSSGVVTALTSGSAVVWAMDDNGDREFWNIIVN